MLFDKLKIGQNILDRDFEILFPEEFRRSAFNHWTPIEIIKRICEFINEKGCQNILDIGSGVGKFCLIGSLLSSAKFHGVEIRKKYHLYAISIAKSNQLNNAIFSNLDICEVSFEPYDCFYYFNPFFETLDPKRSIDDQLILSENNRLKYIHHVKSELHKKPIGTILVTYFTNKIEIPNSYKLMFEYENLDLCFWEKNT
jgi:predicted RNA methylase